MAFDDLGLSDALLNAVRDAGYTEPTPIQAQAIPVVLMGRDVLGCAQTGTGKTASFTLPMIEILASGRARARMPRSLILTPTREIAQQVAENFDKYGKNHNLNKALLIGGVSFDDQQRVIERGADVLIATPGRLLDQFERGSLLLSDIKILVIDEADRMLDMGFIPDVERIVSLIPKIRQTLFFSATMATDIRKLAAKFLMNPKEISVAPPASAAETVTEGVVSVDEKLKRDALRALIATEEVKNALIFCNRKRDIAALEASLKRHGLDAGALHGDMSQPARMETLARFKNNEIRLLVCSDVAARGLDISALSHVFNFDVPINSEDYIHRIGRTGRAGREGRAFTVATPDDSRALASIEKLMGKPIPRIEAEGINTAELGDPEDGGRRRGRRGSKPSASAKKDSPSPARSRSRKKAEDAPEKADTVPAEVAEKPVVDQPVAEKPAPETAKDESTKGESAKGESSKAKPARKKAAPRKSSANKDDGDDSSDTVGLGDHMPAFLMRPVRR
ncbi:MAG: DEAD/DEAH box helicase [Rhodospirillales bacterium]